MADRMDWHTAPAEKKLARIERLTASGKSAAEIADHFIGATRNSIIGFRGRHSAAQTPKAPKSDIQPRRPRTLRAKKKPDTGMPVTRPAAILPPKPILLTAAPDSPRVPFFQAIADGTCKWPLWEKVSDPPQDSPCCGSPRAPDRPYCAHHTRVAYVPRQERRA